MNLKNLNPNLFQNQLNECLFCGKVCNNTCNPEYGRCNRCKRKYKKLIMDYGKCENCETTEFLEDIAEYSSK